MGGSCSPNGCPRDPILENIDNNATHCENTRHGMQCAVVCEEGFASPGNASCSLGEWTVSSCTPVASSPGGASPIGIIVGSLAGLLALLLCAFCYLFLAMRRKKLLAAAAPPGELTSVPSTVIEHTFQL